MCKKHKNLQKKLKLYKKINLKKVLINLFYLLIIEIIKIKIN